MGEAIDRVPAGARRIHVLGIAGTGMGSFAGLLKAAGYEVTGSDENVYPPMSDMLKALGISVLTPYSPANLDAARPDLVVVGNVIRRVNVEAAAMRERGLPHMSFPQALAQLFLLARHSLVVAGTHGKTTTTSLAAHILSACGRDPSLLVGGVAGNFGGSFRLGRGPEFVVEGDEYDTAYFDKGPKFLHYRPGTVIFTSCELDHADIYRDTAHYESAFERLMELVPDDGLVLACASSEPPARIARRARSRVLTYSAAGAAADFRGVELVPGPEGTRFILEGPDLRVPALLPLGGRHNVENAVGAAAAAIARGCDPVAVAESLSGFAGVRRRQELLGQPAGVAVIDDFAHHPTAVRETLAAVAGRFPGRRLVAVFEPRSNTSRRSLHQAEYARSFGDADEVLLSTPAPSDQVPENERLDVGHLAADIEASGTKATAFPGPDDILRHLASAAREGDVILTMSNGAFGGLPRRLVAALAERVRA